MSCAKMAGFADGEIDILPARTGKNDLVEVAMTHEQAHRIETFDGALLAENKRQDKRDKKRLAS